MWQKNVRYLDYNATSGISDHVRLKLGELLADPEILANPSSRHRPGQRARKILFDATSRIAKSLSGDHPGASVSPDDLLFTSSGTEANQSILRSIAKHVDLLIVGAGEHSASVDVAQALTQNSDKARAELALLPNGQYDFSELAQILSDYAKNLNANPDSRAKRKIGLSLTLANNETGVLLNIADLKNTIAQSPFEVILHLDGAQVWGKVPLDLPGTSAQFVTFSSHKIGAPSGVGVIWMKPGSAFEPFILGTQGRGLRGGSENLLGIAAMGFASETLNPHAFSDSVHPLTTRLEAGLKSLGHPIKIWGEESPRVSNTTRFSILQFKSYQNWVELLDLKGFAVSHGSACKAQIIEPSRVLLKMGATKEDALNSLRISFGPKNTQEDVDAFLLALKQTLSLKEEARS